MDEVIQGSTEVVDSSQSTVNSQDTGATAGAESSNPNQSAGEGLAQTPPAFSPNYKVKAYDNEYEIPENFRQYMKDAETEKAFRDVFEQVYALQTMKDKNAKIRQANETFEKQIKERYEPLDKIVSRVGKFINNEDYDSVFDTLNISEEKLQAWMLRKLQMKELPPEHQQMYNKYSANQKQLLTIEEQAEAYRNELESMKAQAHEEGVKRRHAELDSFLQRAEVNSIASQYDSQVGQPGMFKTEVIKRGIYAQQVLKQDITVEQAVNEVLSLMNWNRNTASAPQQPAGPKVVQASGEKKPTLPNLAAKANSPAAQKINSLEDLKRIAAQKLSSQSF
jgi:hypothetical protein